jgi:hypothetical protein
MQLTLVQNQAIQARIAATVGADMFDHVFSGVEFDEVDGDILFVYAPDEETAAEIEDTFALHISILAAGVLNMPIEIVMVLPRLEVGN